jgi:diguanylate cyclase (GGDEF)-like protein/PAS domain S-box-containing protein
VVVTNIDAPKLGAMSPVSLFAGSFMDQDLEQDYRKSVRTGRRRLLKFICIFGGSFFFLTSGVDYLTLGNTSDFRYLFTARLLALVVSLIVGFKIRNLEDDVLIDRLMMLSMLSIATVLSLIPLFRPEDVKIHQLIVFFMALLSYGFIPVRLPYLIFNGLYLAVAIIGVKVVGMEVAMSEIVNILIMIIIANGIGYAAARRKAYLTRQGFWRNKLLADEIQLREQAEQELKTNEQQLISQNNELRDREERLEKLSAETIAIAEDMASAHDVAETSRQRLYDAIDNISEGFVLYDKDLRLIICNQKFKDLYGYSDEEVAKGVAFQTLADLDKRRGIVSDDEESEHDFFSRYVDEDSQKDGLIIKLADGRWLQVRDRKTSTGNTVSLQTEITHIKEAEERIRHLANHDALTDLPSLRLAMDRLSMAISTSKRNETMSAILFIDLDGFKSINDTMGHAAGDFVLKEIAKRLANTVRKMDTAARIGGDEFLVILSAVSGKSGVVTLADKLVEAVHQPIKWQGQTLTVGASVGIALYPDHGDDAEELLKLADTAMYAAKSAGKNQYTFAS